MKPTPSDPQDQDLSHLLTQQTLPWIVNGTASEAQHASVAAHLLNCAACRAEFEHQTQLKELLAQPLAPLPDLESGLERMLKRLDQAEEIARSAPAPTDTRSPASRRSTRISYALAACVALQAIALGVLLEPRLGQDSPSFQTLSQAKDGSSEPRAQVRVVPDERLTIAEWTQLLHEFGLQVGSGPNTAGAYVLELTDGRRSSTDTVEQLRRTGKLRLAEALGEAP